MERGRWIYDERIGKLVDADKFQRTPPKRSELPAPMVIGDTMDAVQSQLDGRMYESKSALRKTYRQAGVVEVGNDPQRFNTFKKPRPDRKAIKTAVEKAAARISRGERTEAYKQRNP